MKVPKAANRDIELDKPPIKIANAIKSMVFVPFIFPMSGENIPAVHI